MKFVLAIVALLLSVSSPALALTAYRDSKENLYFTGRELPPNSTVEFTYEGASTRYQEVQMYRHPNLACPVHRLWGSSKFKLSLYYDFFDLTLRGTPVGDISFKPNSLTKVANNTNPCNGGLVRSDLPWKELKAGSGIKAISLIDNTRFKFRWKRKAQDVRLETETIYIIGLSSKAFQVNSTQIRQRFAKVDRCGLLKLPVSVKYPARANDQGYFSVRQGRSESFYNFRRSTTPIKPDKQIPKCLGGRLFLPVP
ncbi:hypothetical protein H6F43_03565 [Leptolyngbya sp. FACHB-36]|uniref:hypothetical protein n=1 Tax=Leptolyngbya sp. FACHB-36 TaxID=2692808 RepID=UPI0016814982|nr:hypothetical protein [Leptolyngbya sp. FACHB-36]MBD2019260.1 hypothetical protein [Leptolyngbya sp. FACHB-36]